MVRRRRAHHMLLSVEHGVRDELAGVIVDKPIKDSIAILASLDDLSPAQFC